MKLEGFRCDECGKTFNEVSKLQLHTKNLQSNKSGIMFPRNDWDFCSISCLLEWLGTVRIRE